MSATLADVRYALRSMRGNPGFTMVAVASLALGIGVNTAIFSLLDQTLLWRVPARAPDRLVNITGGYSSTYPFYREYRARNRVFSAMLASTRPLTLGVRPEGAPAVDVARVSYVSGNYFETLGAGAAVGRVLMESDDLRLGGSQVAVASYDYWQRRLAGSPGVIGRKLAVNGYPLEIVGVAEKGFGGLFNGDRTDVFVPLTLYPLTTPASASVWNTPNMHWLSAMARLKPGVSIEQAQASMRVLWPQVAEAAGGHVKIGGDDPISVTSGAHGIAADEGAAANPLTALMAAAGLVLLIACANIASLLLARSEARGQEIAIRVALGATRARLIRQILTESLVLAAMGGAAGVALAYWTVAGIAAANLAGFTARFEPSLALIAFSVAVTLITGIMFGLAPALRISGGKDAKRSWHGKLLIAGQAALSLTLLVGAALFIRSVHNLESVDAGFQRENVVIVDVGAPNCGYRGHRLRFFYDQLLERMRSLPVVRSAALAGMMPMGGYAMSRSFSAEGYQPPPGEPLIALSNPVSEGYFTTLGIPMLVGRDFRPQDEPAATPRDNVFAALGRMGGNGEMGEVNASPIAVITQSLARKLFGGANAVGRHISFDTPYFAEGAVEIVGVVKDIRYFSVRRADSHGVIYVPSWSHGAEARLLTLRISGDAAPVLAAIRHELRDLDPNVPLLKSSTLEDDFTGRFQRERTIAWLCGCFGALAMALAAVGLYGVTAYAVARRTKEVGIRMALGAGRADVAGMIVRQALAPVACGIAIGIAGALAVTRVAAGLLFGVTPRDPLSFVLAAAVLLAAALPAAFIPARRASRVEPVTALRHE